MPRFTRPAYMTLRADGVRTATGTGPRHTGGTLSAVLTLRTRAGDVSDPIDITAGWSDVRATFDIPRTMSAVLETLPDGRTVVTVRPS